MRDPRNPDQFAHAKPDGLRRGSRLHPARIPVIGHQSEFASSYISRFVRSPKIFRADFE
jgi:hypothetical protein